jgi:molecular chaperone IbpA
MDKMYTNSTSNNTYPPYNIVKAGDNDFTISLAVAGFKMDDLDIIHEGNKLSIQGEVKKDDTAIQEYLYKGIANRSFMRVFTIAEYMDVTGASLEFGILTIYIKRNIPERLQPRKIEIKN